MRTSILLALGAGIVLGLVLCLSKPPQNPSVPSPGVDAAATSPQSCVDIEAEPEPKAVPEDPIVTRIIEATFSEVTDNVRMAIIGKGINIAHVLPAGQMLHRTGADFGYADDVYVEAEIFEFCSADLSQQLARAHPDNILMCPFSIGVYVIPQEPAAVRVSYRIPRGRPGAEAVVKKVVALMESILDDASW